MAGAPLLEASLITLWVDAERPRCAGLVLTSASPHLIDLCADFRYSLALSNVVGGQRGALITPAQLDVGVLDIDPAPAQGTALFKPAAGSVPFYSYRPSRCLVRPCGLRTAVATPCAKRANPSIDLRRLDRGLSRRFH